MEAALTYQQVLADVYEENAKEVLVCPNDDYSDIGPEDKHPDELENQEAFRGEQIGHQIASVQPDPPKYEDRTTQSIKYRTETQITVLNVDSRFRDNRLDPTTNFLFRLLEPIKNVISIRVASVEVPNSFYAFSAARNNVTFDVTYYDGVAPGVTKTIQIGNGNYNQNAYPDPASILTAVQLPLETSFPTAGFSVTFDFVTGLVTISVTNGSFDVNFIPVKNNLLSREYGLGYNLGFRQFNYYRQTSLQAEAILNVTDTNYIFLSLDDEWKVTLHETPSTTQLVTFAKIVINSAKNQFTYDNNGNTITREYFFRQPTNISNFQVRLSDPYDQDIDLVGLDFSFTLEMRAVMNSSLYDSMRGLTPS
jgi:hypothetical protein